jgi:hypothetical protein
LNRCLPSRPHRRQTPLRRRRRSAKRQRRDGGCEEAACQVAGSRQTRQLDHGAACRLGDSRLGGISFAVGRVTAAGQSGTGSSTAAGANGFPGFGANASRSPIIGPGGVNGDLTSGTATVSGSVVSVTSGSITIQEANGRTVTIATGSSTAYHNQTSASGTDVTTGATVIVQTSATGAQSGSGPASASASPGTNGTRTATSVTITGS